MIKINLIIKKKGFLNLNEVLSWFKEINVKLLFAIIVIDYLGSTYYRSSIDNSLKTLKEELTTLRKEEDKHLAALKAKQSLEDEYLTYKKQITNLEVATKHLQILIKRSINPFFILENMALTIPKNVWINQLKIEEKNINISGETIQYASLGLFISNLNKTPFFLNHLKLATTKTIKKKYDGFDVRVEEFEFTGRIESFDPSWK